MRDMGFSSHLQFKGCIIQLMPDKKMMGRHIAALPTLFQSHGPLFQNRGHHDRKGCLRQTNVNETGPVPFVPAVAGLQLSIWNTIQIACNLITNLLSFIWLSLWGHLI